MLTLFLVVVFVCIFLLSIVKKSRKHILKPWGETKFAFRYSTSSSDEAYKRMHANPNYMHLATLDIELSLKKTFNYDSENLGVWNFLKTIAIVVIYSRKNPTHHETANLKMCEHFKQCSINSSKLKFKFFGTSIVYPNSAKSIRQFINNEKCGNKIPENFRKLLTGDESKGIMFAKNDATYKELRKYTVKTLGKLGFGKNGTMSVLLDETLNDFIEHLETLRKYGGNKIKVQELFSLSVINIVWVMVGGQKFTENDEKFHKLKQYVFTAVNESWLAFLWGNTFPKTMLNILQWLGVKCQSLTECYRKGSELFLEYIEQIELDRRSKRNSEEIENNFVSHFITKIEKHKGDDKLSKIYTKTQLANILAELFAAAIDTTGNFMECFIMYMVMYPDVQARVFLEIKDVVGYCSPSFSAHSKRMPYTQAVIMEIHRMANIVPIILRSVKRDCEIESDTLKKNTLIFVMQATLNLDEAYWGDAKIFRPERFLGADNNLLSDKVNYMMPFGAGLRACPGENVAKATIFTLIVGILQRYTLIKSNKEEFLGLYKSISMTSGPEPFHVSLFFR